MSRYQTVLLGIALLAGFLGASIATADHVGGVPPVGDQFCGPWYYEDWSWWSNYWGWDGWEDEEDWYCYYQWYGGSVGIHATRAEILETGTQGFGFTLDRSSGLQPGESNATFEIIWDMWSHRIEGEVDGLEFAIELSADCFLVFGFPPCAYWPQTLELGEGWVADNGLDFSGTVLDLGPIEWPAHFDGRGFNWPLWPYDPIWGAFVNDIDNRRPIEVQLEDFFGITFRISFEQNRTDTINAPEPGFAMSLALGCLLLVGLRRRAR